jgi:UDP:flavonoid glycosyltransferase YjiC (YdhE family)
MKVLLSSIGSRGDVQPILALAVELKRLGHDAKYNHKDYFGIAPMSDKVWPGIWL